MLRYPGYVRLGVMLVDEKRFDPVEQTYVLPDFRFASGEVLPELRMRVATLGELRRNISGTATNAVLILHGTGGSGQAFLAPHFADLLFGPGQPLDARNYFLVLPDAIGHGGSSKPSDGLRGRFPNYVYGDMVRAQRRLLREALGIGRLRLVMGTSMGGMHTWLWGITYPDAVDALMPLASLPVQIAGRNRMLRRMIIDAIREDPAWRGGDYVVQPRGLKTAAYVLLFMVSCPWQWQRQAPTREDADRLLSELVTQTLSQLDANDLLYQVAASRDYDPWPDLEKIQAPLFAINSADDQVNPPELGLMEGAIARIKGGRYILIPVSPASEGHRTHSRPAQWHAYLRELLALSLQRGA